jgi:hypothetical protein
MSELGRFAMMLRAGLWPAEVRRREHKKKQHADRRERIRERAELARRLKAAREVC